MLKSKVFVKLMQFGSLLFIVVFQLYLDFTSELLNQGVSLNNYILNHLKKNLVLYIKEDLLYKFTYMQCKLKNAGSCV